MTGAQISNEVDELRDLAAIVSRHIDVMGVNEAEAERQLRKAWGSLHLAIELLNARAEELRFQSEGSLIERRT